MPTANVDDVKAHLPERIVGLNPGEHLVIEQDGEPIATLTRRRLQQWPCKAGSARNTRHWMAPDFDAPLEDFPIVSSDSAFDAYPVRRLW